MGAATEEVSPAHEMRILGGHPKDVVEAHPEVNWKRGDTRIIWSRDNQDEVVNARRTFDDLVRKGFLAFRVEGKEGMKGEQIKEFDPNAERLILTPALRGGA